MSWRQWLRRNQEPFWAVVLFGLWVGGYYLVGSFFDPNEAYSLSTFADENVPFVPLMIFPYLALYSVFLLPFFLVRGKEFFRVCALSYITVMVFSYLIFWGFPVIMNRAEFEVVDFATWAVATVYAGDVPANCFPSMHAAMSMMAALTIYHVDRRRGMIVLGVTILIGFSALMVKQHYIADILAGWAVALMTFYAYFQQRVQDIISRDLRRVPQAIDHYIDEVLERRLDSLIERKVDEKLRDVLPDYDPDRRDSPQKKDPSL
ncbi:MAG: phosphatase PAP2 family protein [Candidatus Lernaella stagnicola]|nr:phosphatase PAP2 family protein [Candidatus Lernaella stagnicola]